MHGAAGRARRVRGRHRVWRSFSAMVLARYVDRDNQRSKRARVTTILSSKETQLTTWLTRENDLRGFVVAKGYAHAIAHWRRRLGCAPESLAQDWPDGAAR
ncbi:MAG: DUF2785 domain-containing protein [Marmoricola sp.]